MGAQELDVVAAVACGAHAGCVGGIVTSGSVVGRAPDARLEELESVHAVGLDESVEVPRDER